MKILIVSDLHEHKIEDIVPVEILDSIDFIISSGDYQENYPFPKEAIGIYGNHDVDPNHSLISVNHEIKQYKGMSFLGIEGVFCGEKRYKSPRKRPYHQLESEVARCLSKMDYVTFFITHERAFEIFDDKFNTHPGNKALRKYIDEKKPKFYISGHMSNNKPMMIVGETLCLNPHGFKWDYIILTLVGQYNSVAFYKGKEKVAEYESL